jgi:hypothetical protein
MTNTLYANAESKLVSTGGGVVQVEFAFITEGADSKVEGNTRTSYPCRVCYITAEATAGPNIRMLIDKQLTAAEFIADFLAGTEQGIEVPTFDSGKYLEVAIDDVSKLWFYSTLAGDLVNITYRN